MNLLLYSIMLFGILIDQIIKCFIINLLDKYSFIPIINKVFNLTYVENTGGAFSILSGNRIIFIVITIIALLFFYVYFIKNKKLSKLNQIIYGVILAGIIGNFIDRLFRGFVIDYIDLSFINFPIFNLADVFIVVGTIVLSITIIKEEQREKNNKPK